jgi:hypothetical protein
MTRSRATTWMRTRSVGVQRPDRPERLQRQHAFSAQSADSATSAGNSDRVDGLPARTFSWDVAEGSAGKTLLNLEGLFMRTSACPTGDASQSFDIFASTVTNNSCVRFHPSAQPDQDDDFDTIDGDQPVKAGSDGSGLVVYHRGIGGVVTVELAWSKTADRCFAAGTALGGSGTQDLP